MRIFFILLFLFNLLTLTEAEEIPTTGYVSDYSVIIGGYCPTINWNEYKVCQAICPKGMKPLSPPNNGVYSCIAKGKFGVSFTCTYINPYCLTNSTVATEFLNPLGKISLTEYMIRATTLDPALWKISLENKLKGELAFIVETFNQVFPLFINVAYFIFIVVFLMSLVYLAIVKSVDFFKESSARKIDLADYFVKGFIVFTFFGLPIQNTSVEKNGVQYIASATPLALEVVRFVLLEVNNLLTEVANKVNQLYAEKTFEMSKDTLTKLYKVLDLNQKNAQESLNKYKGEFQANCVNLAIACGENGDFLIEDNSLKDIQFWENGQCIKDYAKAVYCRNLQLKINALTYFLEANKQNEKIVENVLSEITTEGEKLVESLKKTSEETTQRAGWLSTGINIPIIHLVFTEKISSKLQNTLSQTVIPQTPEEKEIKTDEGIAKALSYLMIVSIPPFNTIFEIIKQVVDKIGSFVETIVLAGLSLLGTSYTGGLSLLLILAIPFIVKLVNVGIALAITLFIAFTVLHYAILIGIAGATTFRTVSLAIEIFTYSLAMPFKLLYIFITNGSIQAIVDFVKNLTRFSLMMLFIMISPLVGLFVMIFIKLALDTILPSALYIYKLYEGGVVAFVSYYLLLSVVFLFTYLGAFILALRFTYTFPDIIFKLLSPFVSHFASEDSQILWQRFSGIITPRL